MTGSAETFLSSLDRLGGPATPPQAHRVRTDLAAVTLTNQLRAHVAAGCANPADIQLLVALDRWAAGELV